MLQTRLLEKNLTDLLTIMYRHVQWNQSPTNRQEQAIIMSETSKTTPQVQLAIGRLFLMLSRPEQPGDIETFHKIRAIVLDSADCRTDYRPNYVAQRMTGAQGDFA